MIKKVRNKGRVATPTWLMSVDITTSYFIFSPGSLHYSDVFRCESGRCRTLPFILTFFTLWHEIIFWHKILGTLLPSLGIFLGLFFLLICKYCPNFHNYFRLLAYLTSEHKQRSSKNNYQFPANQPTPYKLRCLHICRIVDSSTHSIVSNSL